jgi:hypothetical protein
MTLNFLNPSRSYDPGKQSVRFWGHDSALEIVIEVRDEALQLLCPSALGSGERMLKAFDDNRSKIEQVAAKLYGRRRQSFFRLAAKDF